MSDQLFNEFSPVTSKQWKQNIQFDLKGEDYNNALIWKSNEDISVKPFYNSEDTDGLPIKSNATENHWIICQTIFVANVEISNLKAISAIENGAENIKFIIPSDTVSIEDLLKNINSTSISIHFELQFLSVAFVKKLVDFSGKTGIDIHTDIIGNLTRSGNWFHNLKDDFNQFDSIVEITNSFSIDTTLYQNAGANIIQQLAYGMSHASEYLIFLDSKLSDKAKQSIKVNFQVSIGSNHFFEIAKLRTLRLLWNTLALKFGFNSNCQIFSSPSKRNKTLYDYNINMLRTTTECMSAILGSSNIISNIPYDSIYHKVNAFGNRMAINQLLILKHESYFDKVNNPSDGAYYIESLTNQMAEKALDLFKNIEANGGFLKQLKDNTIQRKIKESAEKEQQQFDASEIILLGTNKHISANDRMKDELELFPFVKINQRKTLIEPIIEKRLSEKIEQQRLKKED